jgi:murein tripeptide amidase MpaA
MNSRQTSRCVSGLFILSLFGLFCPFTQPGFLKAATGHRSTPLRDFRFDFDRWPYPLHAEVNARLQELARKYSKICRTMVIGQTREGRDMTLMEITNEESGPGSSKPALWLDANIHAGEITGRLYLSYFIERLLFEYGKNPDVTRLVDSRTFYVLPVFDADGGERELTRHPAWPGYKKEEHPGQDLDGDGYITQIRVKDETRAGGYRYYLESPAVLPPDAETPFMNRRQRDSLTGEREATDFNRNWSAEWLPEEPGAGPYPFSQPELRAVADFLTTTHKNIFFVYSIHSGGGESEGRSYLVRPLMDHPYEEMQHEDNDFYVRAGAIWSYLSAGNIIENNYYSFLFNTSEEDEKGNQKGYGPTMAGFMSDFIYSHVGLHCVLPEISGSGVDYDKDGYVTFPELERWAREDMKNKFFSPWAPYDHPVLGKVEVGGSRGLPPALGDRARFDCESQFDWLLYIADLSPLLRIKDLTAAPTADGKYRITATVRNEGCLSTYVTRNAIQIRRDYPVVAEIKLIGGRVPAGQPAQSLGHIPGKWAYIRYWIEGQDRSAKTVEWTVQPDGPGPIQVTVEVRAPKAGTHAKTITISR